MFVLQVSGDNKRDSQAWHRGDGGDLQKAGEQTGLDNKCLFWDCLLFVLFCILKIIFALQGRRPEKEEEGRREKGVKIILFTKRHKYFPKMVSEMMDEHWSVQIDAESGHLQIFKGC